MLRPSTYVDVVCVNAVVEINSLVSSTQQTIYQYQYQYQWSKYQYKYQYLTFKYQYRYKYCA